MDDFQNNKWKEMIIWYPTDLSKKVYIGSIEFILYLRWKHDDPFTYSIYIEDRSKKHLEHIFEIGIFIDELFKKYGRRYEYKEFDKDVIKKDTEIICEKHEKPKIIKNHPKLLI